MEKDFVLTPELEAMISLIDDDDETVFNAVSKRLLDVILSDRPEAAELMRQMVGKKGAASELASERIDRFIDDVQFQKLAPQFRRTLLDGPSLEDLGFLIAQIGYPDADISKCKRELQRLERELKTNFFTPSSSEMDKVFMLSVLLFEKEGYRGNSSDYYDPDNSYLNRVIERKMGIPISLGAIYLMLAERLRLPVYGINMPAHFMLKYETAQQELFIDPFGQGRVMEKEDCIRFLKNAGYGYVDQYLARASTIEIAVRMMNNLRNSYSELGKPQKSELVEQYLNLIRSFESGDDAPASTGGVSDSADNTDLPPDGFDSDNADEEL
ncbi:MAG: hypothetical protein IAF08_02795 [Rhizobacter sp.]|nr:hypothetical protein [Chlorobiales bacterium]